jgi:hypothetical protein
MLRVLNLPIQIDWRKFEVGSSFFIPCTDRTEVEQNVLYECQRMGFEVVTRKVISKGMYGVRVWRTK